MLINCSYGEVSGESRRTIADGNRRAGHEGSYLPVFLTQRPDSERRALAGESL
jgi:hypothetical protein